MLSARRPQQFALLALCGALGAGSLTGCETTQEKASAQRAESARILKARAKRQAEKKKHEHGHKPDHNQQSQQQKQQQKGEG